jgi:Mg-chelatase subunit ChlD
MRGNAYLFPPYSLNGENITIKVKSGSYEASQSLVYGQESVQISLSDREAAQPVLDLMFVIDTTGSMGDEMRYISSEISDVIGAIAGRNPNQTINLALLFYRDNDDDYVTRYFDFTTNISQQQQNLAKQSANGGGDFPEASDKALEEATGKEWSGDNATRLIFHVCDAPPHDNQGSQTRYFNAVRTSAEKGIRIIPVASSGIDLNTEYLLRQEALMTGGTYIFLTDDSGIGDSHMEPTVGDYTVEYLNACMVRVVNEYLTGIETKPVPY